MDEISILMGGKAGFGKRIIIASGEGAKAVLSAKKYLLSETR